MLWMGLAPIGAENPSPPALGKSSLFVVVVVVVVVAVVVGVGGKGEAICSSF